MKMAGEKPIALVIDWPNSLKDTMISLELKNL
jgi:hypothetical protein